MADNVTLDAGSGGATLATDDVGGIHYQINKLAHGALDAVTLVSTASGLPVQMQGTWNVTNAGTFVVQEDGAALTALQLIDNIVLAEDAAHGSGDAGVQMLAVRKATPADLSGADGDYEPLQLDNGRLWASALITGDALTALQLIDDVVAVLGTATYTETSTKGNVIGVVRNDALAALAGTDNEIAPLQVNAAGALYAVLAAGTAEIGKLAAGTAEIGKLAAGVAEIGNVKNAGTFVVQVDGDALTALQLIDDVVAVLGTATYTEATSKGNLIGAVRNDALAALADTDNEIAPLQVNASGALYAVLAAGAAVVGEVTIGAATGAAGDLAKIEDAQHASGDVGVMSLAVRNDALAALGATDGDYVPFQVDAAGALYTRPHSSSTGGCKMFTSVDLDESEEDPAAGPVTIYGIYVWNATAAPLWLQMFNTNTVTVGTTAPTNNFLIPANADSDGAGVVIPIPVCGLAYSTALTVAVTTGSGTNNGAPAANAAGIAILYQD